MSSTRDAILSTLKAASSATLADLAAAVGVTTVSVRHHLSGLQADGLVVAEEARHGVGRPHLVYSLSEAGLERFPARYVRFSGRLLDELKSTMTGPEIEGMFTRIAESIVADHAHRLVGKSLEEKMALVVELLGEEGFMAAWTGAGGTYQLTEYNCPYLHIGQKHPEVCRIDHTLISQALAVPVERSACLLEGDEHCTFTISPAAVAVSG
jgi:DeoR family suf operon transcriptional repressor